MSSSPGRPGSDEVAVRTTTGPGLRIAPADVARIRAHGESAYPEECCGVLIGRDARAGEPASVDHLVAADNERTESRHNRYVISPQALLAAQRGAREQGLEIVGYYHSHPDHPARPSEFDREHAWPGTSYVIVSVRQGKAVDCRSWRLRDDRSAFDPEELNYA